MLSRITDFKVRKLILWTTKKWWLAASGNSEENSAVSSLFNFWTENLFRLAKQKFCGYCIRLTRNARNCSARSGKLGSSHCYVNRLPLHEIDEIVCEYDRKKFHRLVQVALPRVIFNALFNIIRVCRSRYVLSILFKK